MFAWQELCLSAKKAELSPWAEPPDAHTCLILGQKTRAVSWLLLKHFQLRWNSPVKITYIFLLTCYQNSSGAFPPLPPSSCSFSWEGWRQKGQEGLFPFQLSSQMECHGQQVFEDVRVPALVIPHPQPCCFVMWVSPSFPHLSTIPWPHTHTQQSRFPKLPCPSALSLHKTSPKGARSPVL